MKTLKFSKKSNQEGFIPLLIALFIIIIAAIVFAFLRVRAGNNLH